MIGYYSNEKENFFLKQNIMIGSTIRIKGKLKAPSHNTIPNTFSYRKYLKSQNIFFEIEIEEIELIKQGGLLAQVRKWIINRCNRFPYASYLKQILLGIKEKTDIEEVYRQNGLSHIFVISGMHMGMIYQWFQKFCSRKVSTKKSQLIALIILTIYRLLIIPSASSKRAYSFFVFLSWNKWSKINLSTKQIFWFNLCFHLIQNPSSIFQISFQYSFLLSFAFLYFKKKSSNQIWNLFYHSLLAFLFSLPITAYYQYAINPWSILINCIMLPIITKVLFPCLILSFAIFPLQIFVSKWIHIIEKLNTYFFKMPEREWILPKVHPILPILYFLILILLLKFKKRIFRFILVLILLFWHYYYKLDYHGYLFFLDVGQGDSCLIISPYQKEVILLDTGYKNKYLTDNFLVFLKSYGLQKINLLILSHGDNDHLGNAKELLKKIEIDYIWMNEGRKNAAEIELEETYPSKIITKYQPINLSFHNLSHVKRTTENENSLVFHICIYKMCTLFLGDLDRTGEEEIIRKYHLNASLLKVAHHGAKTSTSEELLRKIQFKMAIISAGRNNQYLHPHNEVLKKLAKYQITILNTQEQGTISWKITPKRYTIITNPP